MAVAAQLHNWGASREQHDTTAEGLTNEPLDKCGHINVVITVRGWT